MRSTSPIERGLDGTVVPVRGFRGRLDAGGEPAALAAAKAEIAEHWRAALAERPRMFDGRVLLGVDCGVEDGEVRARYAEVAFSAFNWWRAAAPASGLRNVFGAAAVVTSDGAVLMGRMAPHTAVAGKVYFPCGTPDLGDVAGGAVDLDGSIARELCEETGLTGAVALPTETRFAVFAPKVLAYVRKYVTLLDAASLQRLVEAELASQADAELDAVMLARSPEDIDERSPAYVHLILPKLLGR